MNRQQRRASGTHKTAKLDPVIAIHEAGHAVARILAADQLGRPPEEVISYIEVGSGKVLGNSAFDETITLRVQATVYGPMLSNEIQATFKRTVADTPKEQITNKHIEAALVLAREEGVNVDGWLK